MQKNKQVKKKNGKKGKQKITGGKTMNGILELEKALDQNDYEKVSAFFGESTKRLKKVWNELDLKEAEREIDRKKAAISFLVKKEHVNKNAHFVFGRYIGFVDAIYDKMVSLYKDQEFKESINALNISIIPHINDIIATIYSDEGIRHGTLAEKVGIEKSTLTGIMDKLVEKGAVRFSRPGKYKYYYLTELGSKYFEENRSTIEAETNIDALTEQLLLALSKYDDANTRVLRIIEALAKGKSAIKGYNSKARDNIEPSIIFIGIPAIQQLNVSFMGQEVHKVNSGYVDFSNPSNTVVYLTEGSNVFAEEDCEIAIMNMCNQ